MLIYNINAYRSDDRLYIATDNAIFEINIKTFSKRKVEKLPEGVEELPIEFLCTKKIDRVRFYAIEIYSEPNVYAIIHYDPYSSTTEIPFILLNEQCTLVTLENLISRLTSTQ